MSKSRGNVLYADELAAIFGVDAIRYYLLTEIPFAQDGTITYENIINRYNTDLANTLGNLVNRCIAMTNKYFGGRVTRPAGDADLAESCLATVEKYRTLMDTWHNAEAAEAVMELAKRCNKYIDETAPWALAKDEANRAGWRPCCTTCWSASGCSASCSARLCPPRPGLSTPSCRRPGS